MGDSFAARCGTMNAVIPTEKPRRSADHEGRIRSHRTDHADPLAATGKVGELAANPRPSPFSVARSACAAATVNHHDVWSPAGRGTRRRTDADDPRHRRRRACSTRTSPFASMGSRPAAEVVLYTFVGTDGAGVVPRASAAPSSPRNTPAPWPRTLPGAQSANVFAKPAKPHPRLRRPRSAPAG